MQPGTAFSHIGSGSNARNVCSIASKGCSEDYDPTQPTPKTLAAREGTQPTTVGMFKKLYSRLIYMQGWSHVTMPDHGKMRITAVLTAYLRFRVLLGHDFLRL